MAQQIADYETYKRIKLLGEGAFGKAYLAECISDGALCVIKQVDLSKMSEQEKKDTLREAKILESFNHPNIVKFKEVYKTKKGKLCIVMDYADGGDLSAKIKAQKTQPFPENQVLDWFTQICLAIKHVHDRKIIHRDLKGQNIFLTSANIIKLGDFGIARVLSSTRENAKTMVGTPYYLSPEIINGKPYSFKSDIWSLGVVLYELCALRPPFDAQSLTFLAMKIVKGQYAPIPYQFSKEMKNLVATLLQVEPSRRPTVNDILKNSLIQNRIQNFLSKTVKIQEFSHTVLHKQQFVKNNVNFADIKSVNNEAPIPTHLLKAQQQQQQDKPKPVVQQAAGKPTPPLINPNALPDKVPSSGDTPQFNRPQNHQGQDRPQLFNQNNQPKPNFHYRNSPNNPEPEPYKGPKIVDASKDKPVEQKKPDRIPPWQLRSPEEVQKPKVVEPPKNNAINRPQNPFYAQEPKPQVQPAMNRPEPVKRIERDILGGGLGGGGGLVVNFAPERNKKEVVKKPVVAAPASKKQPQKSVQEAKREAQQKLLDMKKKMEMDKQKKLDNDKMRKEKKALEEAERKQVIENQRQEREKDREEMRKKMRQDMDKRKEAFKKGKTKDFDVEIVGYETNSLNDLGAKESSEEEKQEEEVVKNEQVAKVHKAREVRVKEERPRESSVPEREPEVEEEEEDNVVAVKKPVKKTGPGKFARNRMNRAFTKNANDAVEIFLPGHHKYDGVDPEQSTDRETQEETKVSEVSSKKASPKSERNVEDGEPEMQKDDPFFDKLEENLENLGEKNEALNQKEIEEVQNISALIDVLNRTVKPELDANEAELTHLEVFSSKSEEQEDRDDDEIDDLCLSESNPAETKKFNPEEESMEYIMDYSKLEVLQMKLDNILGHDIFLKAYRVAKDLLQKHTLDEIEQKYGQGEDGYEALFPFMSEEARKNDLGFLFTYVICEEKAEQTAH